MAKKKFYVVWKGRESGIYTSWNACKKQVDGFDGAQYKAFIDKHEAEKAIHGSYNDYKGIDTKKKKLSQEQRVKYGSPVLDSISVDAACAGNPGKMEYRGVYTGNKKQLFLQGPFKKGTNNIGEFLALVHALALLKKQGNPNIIIYSDSKIAISWVHQKKCKTKLIFDISNNDLQILIKRAEQWLSNNIITNPILKWETKAWGEIPADFGRK